MLVKHILIVGMIAAGFGFNAILRIGPMPLSKNGSPQAFDRFRLYVNGDPGFAFDGPFAREITPKAMGG